MRSALWLPLFDELADPIVLTRLAVEAEEAGWDGVFVWDHVNWHGLAVADAWIALAAIAGATSTIRLGPMVTPLPRRRPAKVARETATLDRLSGGRLVLGVGLGSDRFGSEFSALGEETDDRRRAGMLDESLAILAAAWSGEPVHHHGEHFTVDGMQFRPTPADRIPVWAAGFPGKVKPMRRAAALDGFFPVNLAETDQLAAVTATLAELRSGRPDPYDIAVALPADADVPAFAKAGATWWLAEFDHEHTSAADVRAVLRNGPA
ncbi:LLM class flavin-dependent oxidoreductase [Pseudonocardia sp. CA-107938]|uniref:LLM class flavin-dependent oxidoreductase n=1 Tax=Pseudonocardia sp. CA-107938 TaxID=3240021 RepID=UPI003D8C10D6